MISNILRLFFFLLLCLSCSNVVFSQDADLNTQKQKIIIEGKTYYLHVVKQGEGFYRISKDYGVSQKEIIDANPSIAQGLKVGEIIHIPLIKGRNASENEIDGASDFVFHTVEKGQTLYFLSRKYNVHINDIVSNNTGVDKSLVEGAIIKIPLQKKKVIDASGYAYHTVKAKETLYGISKQYNTTIDSIIVLNPALKNGSLPVNTKLRVPIIKKEDAIVEAIQEDSEEELRIEDDAFIYHLIKEQDTFDGVCDLYNADKRSVERANEGIDTYSLPKDFVLRIPKSAIKKGVAHPINKHSEDYIIHTVRRKETLYSISHKYNVAIDDIKKANNDDLASLKKGCKLKIPTQSYLDRVEEEKQKEKSTNLVKNDFSKFDTISVDCSAEYSAFNDEIITVALLLPFDIEATKRANIITKVVDEEEITMPREKPIISSRSRTFVEFYEGALMALDSLKKQGLNIQLLTYDTAPDSNRVKEILAKPEMQLVDLIIGPAYASNLSIVSEFSVNNHIHLVYPLSSLNSEIEQNPFLFQVNPTDTLFFEQYSDYVVNKSDSARLIIVNSVKPSDNEKQLTSMIKQKSYLKAMQKGLQPDFLEISFSTRDIQGVASIMSADKKNIVIVPSPNEADVSKIVTTLKGVKESTEHDINLIGFNKWLRFQTINPEDIFELNTEIITAQAFDYSNEATQEYIMKYRKWYHTEPYAVAPNFVRSGNNSNYSRYGTWGFDVVHYFVSARAHYGPKFEYCLDNYKAEQIQFNFNFKRSENWSGFYNTGLSVIKFEPNFDVTVNKLQ